MDSLRIGILGAAAIAPPAIVTPASEVPGITLAGVAARDRQRARRFADRYGISRVYDSYADLIAADDLDAVYIPLPNGLHGAWTLRAVAAGKHVLCEKPFTANADEARVVAGAVAASDRVVMEAFHYRYHPLTARIRQLVDEGAIGTVRHVEAHLCFPLPRFSDIRYNLDLAGGATMDAGCYVLHALRTFGPGEPTVRSARARLHRPEVDRAMEVHVEYPGGATGRAVTSMWSARLLDVSLRIVGDAGTIRVLNFVLPQRYHRLSVRTAGGRRTERVPGPATYTCQLRAFRDAIVHGTPVLTDAADAVPTMALIDATYRAAGLAPRRPTGQVQPPGGHLT
ncbi:MAG: oxidoreductase [Actinobacteria bacterium 13_1_20CM_3_71_11]|nr:MAG: oxidoreductase [Actinobacteria bacterium 13_1_20CM_3_71_11]